MQCLLRRKSLIWVKREHPREQALHVRILLFRLLRIRLPDRHRQGTRVVHHVPIRGIFEGPLAIDLAEHAFDLGLRTGACNHVTRGKPEHLRYFDHLLELILAIEERAASMHFDHNTTQRPHVDCVRVVPAEEHFRRSVESGLNVGEGLVRGRAGTSEVNDLDTILIVLDQHYILGLQIAVNHVHITLSQAGQIVQNVACELANQREAKPLKFGEL